MLSRTQVCADNLAIWQSGNQAINMAFWRKGFNLGTVKEETSPADDSSGDNGIVRDDSQLAADAHRAVQPGELTLEEDAAGGLGRHLGLFSTTFLMYESGLTRLSLSSGTSIL